MTGIQETKEVLVAVNELALVVIKHVKDGVSIGDVTAIISDIIATESFKASLAAAVVGITNVPAEIKDIDIIEGGELAICQASFLPKILEALKK